MTRDRGFTLIEAMIVVTIIGILAAIALPSYQRYVYRANRALAKTALLKIAAQQETFYNDRKAYATALTQFNITGQPAVYAANTVYLLRDGTMQAAYSGNAVYTITLGAYSAATVANCTVTGSATTLQYAAKATPVNSQTKDTNCLSLCYGSVGDRGTSANGGSGAGDCWRR